MCVAMYGEPFSKVVDKLRLEDLVEGLKTRDYVPLSMSAGGAGPVEVEFACAYTADLSEMMMLYEQISGGLHEPFRFTVRLTEPDSQ